MQDFMSIQGLTSPIVCMYKLCIIVARRGVMGCAHTYGSDFRCVCACIAQHTLESFHDNLRGNVRKPGPIRARTVFVLGSSVWQISIILEQFVMVGPCLQEA